MEFIPLNKSHMNIIKDIYNYYIENTTATFHLSKVDTAQMESLVITNHSKFPSWVITERDEVIGYCLLTRYSQRGAYDRTAEIVIYLSPDYIGRGIGRKALQFLDNNAARLGFKALLARISSENIASIKLFEQADYFHCGLFKEVGEKFDRIIDVVLMEKLI